MFFEDRAVDIHHEMTVTDNSFNVEYLAGLMPTAIMRSMQGQVDNCHLSHYATANKERQPPESGEETIRLETYHNDQDDQELDKLWILLSSSMAFMMPIPKSEVHLGRLLPT